MKKLNIQNIIKYYAVKYFVNKIYRIEFEKEHLALTLNLSK